MEICVPGSRCNNLGWNTTVRERGVEIPSQWRLANLYPTWRIIPASKWLVTPMEGVPQPYP